MNKEYILVYAPKLITPFLVQIENEDLFNTVRNICNGYETVSVKKLCNIHQGAVFICNDDFIRLDDKTPNIVGSYLYESAPIIGYICIVKATYDFEGAISHVGFNEHEAIHIAMRISDDILKLITLREIEH